METAFPHTRPTPFKAVFRIVRSPGASVSEELVENNGDCLRGESSCRERPPFCRERPQWRSGDVYGGLDRNRQRTRWIVDRRIGTESDPYSNVAAVPFSTNFSDAHTLPAERFP